MWPVTKVATQMLPAASTASEAADAAAAIGRRERLLLDDPGRDDVEGEEARAFGVGDVDGLLVGRQADPVRADDRVGQFGDLRAVRQRVIEAAVVAMVGVA